ncbi:glycosyltransferase [Roseibium litorale]|uniref:Glycosyltransferase n=1 Tax=Roseibium litorale TaxID=2803841 RepID=A0ABR9CQ74_9HYPH|nr:glycosyltransferase [Roseibium litorale]MBD8892421.1 glycosyltransferase [Roseibium litorale]
MNPLDRTGNHAEPHILHLSADYPNPYRNRTTTAIERLVISAVRENGGIGDHVVMSLNRTSLPWKTHFIDCGERDGVRVFAYRYFGLPMGIGLAGTMRRVARKIAKVLNAEGWQPDLIHAHKFAFEGIAGLELCETYGGTPRFFVSVRGESERNVLLFKPNYRPLLRRIAERADMIYHVSAWFRAAFHEHIPEQPAKERLLPNIVGNTAPELPSMPPNGRFATVLHLNLRKRKGLNDLLKGFAIFHEANPDVCLDIIGPGDDETVAAVIKEIDELDLAASVKLLGGMDGKTLFEHLPHYIALALPSHQETFGMVYLEALFAGIPILYSRDTGIDGYLDGVNAGVGVEAGNAEDIASALEKLYRDNAAYRSSIAASGRLLHDRFDPEAITSGYRKDVARVCGSALHEGTKS